MFSSNTDLWSTPQDLFDDLDRVYRFDVDVCATQENAKCATFYTREQDGLAQEWRGTCWMNPPYGREIGKWVAKARRSAEENGATVVCLLPARTDTRWWHEHCAFGRVSFIRGRIKFGGSTTGAPFPSAIVVFGAKDER
jgi:phage N-6-adenine-methyltransferase